MILSLLLSLVGLSDYIGKFYNKLEDYIFFCEDYIKKCLVSTSMLPLTYL